MTDTTNTQPADETQPDTPAAEAETTEEKPSTNREAKYRKELRATEAERDQLRTRVETMMKGEAERMSGLSKGAALWAAGATLEDLTDDEGNLDPDKVRLAAEAARETLGAAPAPVAPKPDPTQGGMGAVPKVDQWKGAFNPKW